MSAIIRIALSLKELEIEPGQKGELGLTIQNLSEIVDQYIVEVEGLDPAWITTSPPRISLFPQDEGQVTIELRPPQAARSAAYDFAVKVISRENPVEWSRVEAVLRVTPVFLFEVKLSPQRKVVRGEDATFKVGLKNPGNVDLALSLSAADPEEACTYRFDPAQLTVEAGATKIVPLTVSPPGAAGEERRLHTFTVKVAPENAPEKARTVTGQLECQPRVVSLGLGLWPQRRSAVGSGTFQVQLDNRGNTDLHVALEATDPGEACAYKFEPPQVALRAGESRQVALTVAPFGRPPAERAEVYDFLVKAVPQEAPREAQQVSGQFECQPKVVSFDLGLSPARTSARKEGVFVIQVRNRGDTALGLSLSAADSDGACDCTLETQRVKTGPGESRELPLRVAPRKKPPRGQSTEYGFTVEAVPDEGPHLSQSADGVLEIRRPKARWRWAIAALLLLAVVGGVAFALLRDGDWEWLESFPDRQEDPAAVPDTERGARFWANPDVVPRGGCTILHWWAERPDAVIVEGPGIRFEKPFDARAVEVSPEIGPWDVRHKGENLEGELEVCLEESTEYFFIVIRDGREQVIQTFVAVGE